MKRTLRTILAPLIVLAALGAFGYYVARHHQLITQLKHVAPGTIILLVVVDLVGFASVALLMRAAAWVYGKRLGAQESFLLNAYSTLINFFGPGQSGPIFRAAYLKKKHGLGIKQFTFSMLLYYAMYAVLNILFALAGSRPWWQTTLAVVGVAAGCVWCIRGYKRRAQLTEEPSFNMRALGWLAAGTVGQVASLVFAFGIELHAVGAHASFSQVLAYTGVANLALFVSLTPGAIGIRESFLLFSQRLHHIAPANIVAANVIDRAAFLLCLGLLFIAVISLHAKDKLRVRQLTKREPGSPQKSA